MIKKTPYPDLILFSSGQLRYIFDLHYRSRQMSYHTIQDLYLRSWAAVLNFGSGKEALEVPVKSKRIFDFDPPLGLNAPPHWSEVDLICAIEVFEHVKEPWTILKDWQAKLRPGTMLLITTPFLAREHGAPKDYYRYTPEALRTWLEEHGFLVHQIIKRGGLFSVLSSLVNWSFFRSSWWIKLLVAPFFFSLGGILYLLALAELHGFSKKNPDIYLGLTVWAEFKGLALINSLTP